METSVTNPVRKSFTTHVRVNVTAKDVAQFRANMVVEANARERRNPIAMAINRLLLPAYAATFDGLSVGILKVKHEGAVNEAGFYEEYGSGMGDMKCIARLADRDSVPAGTTCKKAFFRGVNKRAQKAHTNWVARRTMKGLRVAISLPKCVLKRRRCDCTPDSGRSEWPTCALNDSGI